jgi:hypothetical protein
VHADADRGTLALRDEVLHDLATTHPEAAVRLPCWQELDRRHPEEAAARRARVLEARS